MSLKHILIRLMVALLIIPVPVQATEMVDELDKRFKTADFKEAEVVARMSVRTNIKEFSDVRLENSALDALRVHRKLVSMLKKNGWSKKDQLNIDLLDAGEILLETDRGMNFKFKETFRLKAYLSQCDGDMKKYRGEGFDRFFQKKVIDKAENCLTYEEKLQGRNYPY